jgi:hypothetical protein
VGPEGFKLIQKFPNFNQTQFNPKWTFPNSKKFELKYGIEGFELRNNFPYWNFSELEKEF